ncbi:protein-export chaperone SecB [Altererythrobacter sp.]|uniref:protein-export chaperone SecB n=1 Tax=Altererythrobacter sp. TaxID=1872480 RepID=UPI003D08231A
MAEEGDILTDLNLSDGAPNGADNLPSAGIITQYVKDMSVENPNAPEVFQWTEQPQIDLQFNIGSNKVNDEIHEVELKINLTAKTSKGNAYLVELAYCGLVAMRNIPEEHAHAFLFAEAPRLLFPFARAVVADAVRDAGFAPMMMDPIDFNGLYLQQLQAKQQQEAAEAGSDETPAPSGNA